MTIADLAAASGNVARNNGAFDGVDDNAPGLNTWTGNIFGTTAGT